MIDLIRSQVFRVWRSKKVEERRKRKAEVEEERRKKGLLTGREIFMQEGFTVRVCVTVCVCTVHTHLRGVCVCLCVCVCVRTLVCVMVVKDSLRSSCTERGGVRHLGGGRGGDGEACVLHAGHVPCCAHART